MRQGNGKSLVDYSVQDLLQAGDSEFLNWMVVVGAIGDAKASYTAYMPDFVATGWGFVSWKLKIKFHFLIVTRNRHVSWRSVSCYHLSRLLFDLKMNESIYQRSLKDFET